MPIDLGYPALGWFGGEVALHRGATVLRQVAAPSVEPIVLLEAKAHLKVETTAEDALIQGWIVAARQHVEAITGRAMLPQDWELRLSGFPGHCEPIELPLPPCISLLSISTYDAAGAATVLPAEGWQLDAPAGDFATPALVYAASAWPTSVAGVRGAVRIRYRAGYANPSVVPAPLKAAMFLLIGDFFENREGSQNRNLQANPAVDRLLAPYRLPRIL